jgi:Family of unknown function (DUF6600)
MHNGFSGGKLMIRRVRVAPIGIALFLLISAGCASLGGDSQYASSPYPQYVDETIFYAQLDHYGTWVDVEPFGMCWTPDDVDWGWRPYSYGSWAYTDYGWTWISDEPWGWATYHYGRWLDDRYYGWVWVPSNEWAPAWVAWRYSNDWIGWAALPPDAEWGSSGLSGYQGSAIPPEQWCFVRGQHFTDPDLRANITSSARNATLLGRTRDATRYELRGGSPVNEGIDLAAIERASGRRVPQLTIVNTGEPQHEKSQEVTGTTVRMFREKLRPTSLTQLNVPRSEPPSKPAPSAHVIEREREAEIRQAQSAQEREEVELTREHQLELREARSAQVQQQILQRQAAEKKAFEERKAKENQRIMAQFQRKLAKAGADTTQTKGPATRLNVKH